MVAFVDKHLNKFISRKFTVWLTATAMLVMDKMSGEEWAFLSVVYIGAQGAIDAFMKWRGKNE